MRGPATRPRAALAPRRRPSERAACRLFLQQPPSPASLPLLCLPRCPARAGSSIHGCNICGKEGHQAAHCPNGTVGWETKWPRAAWQLDDPDWYGEPNYHQVSKVAANWVAKRRKAIAAAEAGGGEAAVAEAEAAAAAEKAAAEKAAAVPAAAPPPAAILPGGSAWQTFHDAYGRPYYYNASTQTTSWEKPAALGGPAAPAAAVPAAAAPLAAGAGEEAQG